MGFVHNIDVIKPLIPRFGIADIFKIAYGLALPVHIIRQYARRCQPVKGAVRHFPRRVACGQIKHFTLFTKSRRPFYRQRMYGNIFGVKFQNFCKRIVETFGRIAVKPRYKVGIDIIMSFGTGEIKGVNRHRSGMPSACNTQHIVVHCLRIYAYTGCAAPFYRAQFFPCYRIGSAGFYRKFGKVRSIKPACNGIHNGRELLIRQSGGRSAAYVSGLQGKSQFPCRRSGVFKFAYKQFNILRNKFLGTFHRMGNKGTVFAA